MLKFFSTLILFSCAATSYAQNISTIVGGGPHNLQALQTGLPLPSGIAIDSSGNIYVSVVNLHQIWKISTSGQVNVFAGNGSFNYNGDGFQALSATLNQPQGLAFDTAGNLYVADTGHNRVRKITTAGVISTVAGDGAGRFFGDGGAATAASLNGPVGVVVDASNNLYIADKNNQRVRKVNSGGTISTVAGNGTAQFLGENVDPVTASLNFPGGVAIDSAGSLYIADTLNARVRKVDFGANRITTFAGTGVSGYSGDGGAATSAQLNIVNGVIIDSSSNVYIVETSDIRLVSSGTISTFAGTGTAGFSGDGGSKLSATFRNVSAMALDSSQNAYLVDAGNYRVRKTAAGIVNTFAGNGSLDYNSEGLLATNGSFLTPSNLMVDNSGSLFFADQGSSAIRKLVLGSGVVSTVAGNGVIGITGDGGAASGAANNPFALTVDAYGTYYFVEGQRVRSVKYGVYNTLANTSATAGFSGDGGSATAATLNFPSGLAVAPNGDLYIGDAQNGRVRLITRATGIITTIAGTGAATSTGDGGLAVNATLNYPTALSLDGAGNLFVSELLGSRVRKINLSSGVISTAAGDGTTSYADGVAATSTGLFAPFSIFADQSSNLFIADQGHSRVRKVTSSTNVISTVAGSGVSDFSGDGGPATSAGLNPLSITIDRSQSLYVADSSGRIRTATVNACFFSFTSTTVSTNNNGNLGGINVYVNSAATTGSITVTASNSSCPYTVSSNSAFVTITSGASGTGSGTINFSISADPGNNRSAVVTVGGAVINVVQAGVFGQSNVGFFQPSGGPLWVLDANGNGHFDGTEAGDKYFPFTGQPGAIAFAGDWNGDGRSKVGYYYQGFWALDYNGNGIYDAGDKFYALGGPDATYVPVVGDWNGDGRTKIGYNRFGFWALDYNGNGVFDNTDPFYAFGGNSGETLLVGDWNGDKRSKIGFYYNGLFVLDYDGNGSFNIAQDKYYNNFTYNAGDQPMVGDWNGDGKTKIGVYRGGFWVLDYNGNGTYDGIGAGGDKFFAYGGHPGDSPIVGDWNGDGKTKIGTYNAGFWTLDFNGNGVYDGTGPGGDRFIPLGGTPGNQPLIGRW